MRTTLAAFWLFLSVAGVGGGQTGPVISAYETLPIQQAVAPAPARIATTNYESSPSSPSALPMEVELARREVSLASHEVDCAEPTVDCSDGVLRPLGSESFWFGSLDLLMMSPSVPTPGIDSRADLFLSPRGTVGWESAHNLGIRGRVWGADADADIYFNGAGPLEMDIQPLRVDFDVYRRFLYKDSSILLGGGVTAAEMELTLNDALSISDRGAGVQFFAEGRHRIARSSMADWTLFARGRWATLTGEWKATNGYEGDSHIEILEAAFGVEWRRRFETADLILQASMESQSWDATLTENVDFIGTVFSIGFAR